MLGAYTAHLWCFDARNLGAYYAFGWVMGRGVWSLRGQESGCSREGLYKFKGKFKYARAKSRQPLRRQSRRTEGHRYKVKTCSGKELFAR